MSTLGVGPQAVHRIIVSLKKHLSQLDECFNFKKSKPKSDNVATNKTNKINKKTNDHFFCQKKSISEPNFTKSEGKIRFGQFFLEMILSTSRKRCYQAESYSVSASWSKPQNGDQNRIYPSLTLKTAKII